MSQIPQGPGGAAGAGGLLGNMLGQRQQGPTVGGVSPGGVLLAGALNQGHGPQGQLVGQGRPQAPQIKPKRIAIHPFVVAAVGSTSAAYTAWAKTILEKRTDIEVVTYVGDLGVNLSAKLTALPKTATKANIDSIIETNYTPVANRLENLAAAASAPLHVLPGSSDPLSSILTKYFSDTTFMDQNTTGLNTKSTVEQLLTGARISPDSNIFENANIAKNLRANYFPIEGLQGQLEVDIALLDDMLTKEGQYRRAAFAPVPDKNEMKRVTDIYESFKGISTIKDLNIYKTQIQATKTLLESRRTAIIQNFQDGNHLFYATQGQIGPQEKLLNDCFANQRGKHYSASTNDYLLEENSGFLQTIAFAARMHSLGVAMPEDLKKQLGNYGIREIGFKEEGGELVPEIVMHKEMEKFFRPDENTLLIYGHEGPETTLDVYIRPGSSLDQKMQTYVTDAKDKIKIEQPANTQPVSQAA